MTQYLHPYQDNEENEAEDNCLRKELWIPE